MELLGLTATPERSDGLPILDWFDDRIAAELRLWDAIDQQRLSPFAYYGIHDGLDLREVPWRRGRGYDVEGLTNLSHGQRRLGPAGPGAGRERASTTRAGCGRSASASASSTRGSWRACSARPACRRVAVWADSPEAERRAALRDLAARRVNVLFSVDLFNEGVDVPAVDTLLLLRPTDSPTLFLQQLGRGLRRAPGKTSCTVLDFVGHHRTEFRFDRRFRALLGGSRKDLERADRAGFPFLPAGCHMELDPVAAEIVLAEHPRGDAVAMAGQGRRAARRSRAATPTSLSAGTSTRPASRSRTSTATEDAGRTCEPMLGCHSRSRGPNEDGAAAGVRSDAARR